MLTAINEREKYTKLERMLKLVGLFEAERREIVAKTNCLRHDKPE